MNNAQNNSTMNIIDLSFAKRLTFKVMNEATAGLGRWELKSGSEFKNTIHFPESDTFVKVAPQKMAAFLDFCRGNRERVMSDPKCVWEWGA